MHHHTESALNTLGLQVIKFPQPNHSLIKEYTRLPTRKPHLGYFHLVCFVIRQHRSIFPGKVKSISRAGRSGGLLTLWSFPGNSPLFAVSGRDHDIDQVEISKKATPLNQDSYPSHPPQLWITSSGKEASIRFCYGIIRIRHPRLPARAHFPLSSYRGARACVVRPSTSASSSSSSSTQSTLANTSRHHRRSIKLSSGHSRGRCQRDLQEEGGHPLACV